MEETKRTIEEVFDLQNQEMIYEKEFFKKSESEIEKYRTYIEEGIQIGKPRFVCSHCGQPVKLSGRVTQKGKVSFFSHLYDSDDCDLKTTTGLTREEILSRLYGASADGEYTRSLREYMYNMLDTQQSSRCGISSAALEPRIGSDIPFLTWRKPDVYANISGRKVVFELQISPTFLGMIVDRDIFYRLNGYYVIWVFNFDAYNSNFSLANLTAKDIYYANKRNVFILDDDARSASEECGKLCLSVTWKRPDNTFAPKVTVPVDELSFDDESLKPFYHDADEDYFSLFPEEKERIALLERSRKEIGEALRQKAELEKINQEKREMEVALIRKKMIREGTRAERFSKGGRWGYAYNGVVLSDAQWTNASEIGEEGFGKVFKGRRWGLVDRSAKIIIPCEFKEIFILSNGVPLLNDGKKWYLGLDKRELCSSRSEDRVEINPLNDILCSFRIIHEKESLLFVSDQGGGVRELDEIWPFENGISNIRLKGRWLSGYSEQTNGYWYYTPRSYEPGKRAKMNQEGIIFFGDQTNRIAIDLRGRHVIIDGDNKRKSDFYDGRIELMDKQYASVCQESKYGLLTINSEGRFIQTIACRYAQKLRMLTSNLFIYAESRILEDSTFLGLVSSTGEVLTDAEYKDIRLDDEGRVMVRIDSRPDSRYGYLDENYKLVSEQIGTLSCGLTVCSSCCKLGATDNAGNVVIPFAYNNIEMLGDKFIIADHELLDTDAKPILDNVCNPRILSQRLLLATVGGRTYIYDIEDGFNEIIPPFVNILSVGQFTNGTAQIVFIKEGGERATNRITDKGEVLLEDLCEMKNGLIQCTRFGYKYLRNKNGDICEYGELDSAYDLNDSLVLAYSKLYNLYSAIDCNMVKKFGISERDVKFEGPLSPSLFMVSIRNKKGLISTKGKVLLKCSYESIELINSHLIRYSEIKQRHFYGQQYFGAINDDGKEIVPAEYSGIEVWGELLLCYGIRDGMALYTCSGKELLYVFNFTKLSDTIAEAEINHNFVLISSNGKELVHPIYSEIVSLSNRWIALRKGNAWALYDTESDKLTPCDYGKIYLDEDGKPVLNALVTSNEKNERIISLKDTEQKGTVSEILPFGIVIRMECNGRTFLIHRSELANHQVKPNDFSIGQVVHVKVTDYDKKLKKWIIKLLYAAANS